MKSVKKLLACFALALCVLLGSAGAAVAVDSRIENQPIAYVSEGEARVLMQEMLISQIPSSNGQWTQETTVSDVLKLYDFDGNTNFYVFRLQTRQQPAGFIQVDANAGSPSVYAFAPDGNFPLDDIYLKKYNRKADSADQVISTGHFSFLKRQKDGSFFDLETDKAVEKTEQYLNKIYKAKKRQQASAAASMGRQASQSQVSPMALTDSYTCAGADALPRFPTAQFASAYIENYCSPAAGTELINYWVRHWGKTGLWSGSSSDYLPSFQIMYAAMHTTTQGSYADEFLYALRQYGKTRRMTPTSYRMQEEPNIELSFFKDNINQNIPLLISLLGYDPNQPDYGHTLVAVGWQQHDGGRYNYLRLWDINRSGYYSINFDSARITHALSIAW